MNLIGKLFFAVRISQDFDQLSLYVLLYLRGVELVRHDDHNSTPFQLFDGTNNINYTYRLY